MKKSRRDFLAIGTAVAGASALAAPALAADEAKIGACGLACSACPLMKAGKCGGCSTGKGASEALLKKKPCPVLLCAAKKGIDYCGTGCKMFTQCKKLIGRPYAQSFIDKIGARLKA